MCSIVNKIFARVIWKSFSFHFIQIKKKHYQALYDVKGNIIIKIGESASNRISNIKSINQKERKKIVIIVTLHSAISVHLVPDYAFSVKFC